ncbi:hypothetical protein E2562_003678 [Oryza meyeriana var. granulata]|uniref:Uncharacterized protein n=1 Tax=Oryza meyeriana var. granulata TaxID=110450 RepID=A0A6G1C4P8_9ORYZ|nr:hypothetical protein E2562_003678 [Oryza meyeriana var. granulata]
MRELGKKREKEEGGMGLLFVASGWRFEAGARRILRESGRQPTWASRGGCGAQSGAQSREVREGKRAGGGRG